MRIDTLLEIDLENNRVLDIINVKQFDNNGRLIKVAFLSEGQYVEISNGSSAWLNASVDGTVTVYHQSLIIEGNTYILIPIQTALTTLAGREKCEIMITDERGRTLYSATFTLNVEPSVATADSAAVLKTTELASTLSSLDARVTTNEEDITELQRSGGGGGGSSTEVLEKLGESEYTTEEYIDLAKTTVTTAITSSETRIKSDAADKKQEILSRISTAEDDIEDFIDATETVILNKLGTSNASTIESQIAAAKSEISSKLGTMSTPIDEQIYYAKSDVTSAITIAKNSVSTEIETADTSIENKIDAVKAELFAEIESVREEFEDKHYESMIELQKAKNEILSVFAALSDELSVGNGTVAGVSANVVQGFIVESYTGKDKEGD